MNCSIISFSNRNLQKIEIMVENYHFKSGEVDDENTLIAVIPSGKNNNGVFTKEDYDLGDVTS